ncbi:hypothetical protein ACJMK2_015117 [Sinanodonta woodiana]|uniref:Uncharacterized protein n=1 Tax=Sinanodonta woodiana TaxID=1069815 RepID=A0ABD3V2N5_SINWO
MNCGPICSMTATSVTCLDGRVSKHYTPLYELRRHDSKQNTTRCTTGNHVTMNMCTDVVGEKPNETKYSTKRRVKRNDMTGNNTQDIVG